MYDGFHFVAVAVAVVDYQVLLIVISEEVIDVEAHTAITSQACV